MNLPTTHQPLVTIWWRR